MPTSLTAVFKMHQNWQLELFLVERGNSQP